ncbi:hypothetical protein TWF970_004339 [Orbilia oligospora]|uniref:Uncharacterized protein n=1 Tax=Orbilia oligospora TaxID=2813651 RepID=A0A7C8RG96_ORBOL|nr:hypothetical protein TWF970_004339 [Orbilia oligospora]
MTYASYSLCHGYRKHHSRRHLILICEPTVFFNSDTYSIHAYAVVASISPNGGEIHRYQGSIAMKIKYSKISPAYLPYPFVYSSEVLFPKSSPAQKVDYSVSLDPPHPFHL